MKNCNSLRRIFFAAAILAVAATATLGGCTTTADYTLGEELAPGNQQMKMRYRIYSGGILTEADQKAIMEHTTWNYADLGYFRGGGYSSRFVTDCAMPATMIRLNLVDGLGPMLQIAEGWTVDLPEEVTDKLWKRTDYTWPCTWFTPRCDG